MNMGTPRNEALRNINKRCNVNDLTKFINAIIQAEKYGTSISNTLEAQADALRIKLKSQAEEIANKAPLKLMMPLIFFVLPGIMILLLGPALIRLVSVFF